MCLYLVVCDTAFISDPLFISLTLITGLKSDLWSGLRNSASMEECPFGKRKGRLASSQFAPSWQAMPVTLKVSTYEVYQKKLLSGLKMRYTKCFLCSFPPLTCLPVTQMQLLLHSLLLLLCSLLLLLKKKQTLKLGLINLGSSICWNG